MRETMTLLEQSNRQRLLYDRTIRHPPVYIFSNDTDTNDVKPKFRSLYDDSIQDMVATGKSMLPNVGRNHFVEISISSSDKNPTSDENHTRPRRKRPSYRKSKYHAYSPNPSQAELALLTARGTRPEYRTPVPMPIVRQHEDVKHSQRPHVPPPSPSYEQMERVFIDAKDKNQSQTPIPKSNIKKNQPVTFRLPPLSLSPLSRRTPTNISTKEVRLNLSNYLQNCY
ncbi:unnamed protein product [Adineta steineri]|uniref:Uncharacterized protein n=1 Tax=Adineta steineri TaxID=433720 RepID=A0A818GE32_9BILA|nr:unnamed protein product [Adineta steineri]CAF3490154.1 unnamed protein product [Adineta steineri]